MRVLWFSVTASCYSAWQSTGHNGGGWIMALEKAVKESPEIELGIAFEYNSDKFKDELGGVTYYPINVVNRKVALQRKLGLTDDVALLMPHCQKVVEDFKPDVIQCFGTEWPFGLIAGLVDVPVVIHMQGSMPSYYNVLYPPKYNKWTSILFNLLHLRPKAMCRAWIDENKSRQRMMREFEIFRANKYFMGRTDWDKALVGLFSPNAKYFHCDEAMRDSFVSLAGKWHLHRDNKKIVFCTTGNGSLWKGLDVILKTASIMKRESSLDFQWKVIGGIANKKYIEWMEDNTFEDVNVQMLGVLDEQTLAEELLNSDIYVHPAYIDNSPNALCEAMMLGLPCVASAVGGIPSIVSDGKDGILVPVNEPYYLASKLLSLAEDNDLMQKLSRNAVSRAVERHSIVTLKSQLIDIYKKIIDDYEKNH